MNQNKILIENIDMIHTTKMGADRIKRNLNLDMKDVVSYCKNLILSKDCCTFRREKIGIVK